MKVFKIENGERIEVENDEIITAFDAFLERLAKMPKEQRLKYFESISIPEDLNFNMDFGETVILARTFFNGVSSESVVQTAERMVQKQ